MTNEPIEYRVWQEQEVWRWEVTVSGEIVAQGVLRDHVAARVAALEFCLKAKKGDAPDRN